MIKINTLSTLYVGIDVSSKSNVVYAMDFEQNKLLSDSFPNNQPGAEKLANAICKCMLSHRNLKVNCKLNLNNYNQETHSIA